MTPPAYFQQTSIPTATQALLTGLGAALAASSPSGPVFRSELVIGEVAFDECNCGLLAITVPRVYVSRPGFPLDGTQVVQNCETGYVAAQLQVVVARCFPVPDQNGNPPTSADVTAASVGIYEDAAIAWQYLDCTLHSWFTQNPPLVGAYVLQDQQPLGASGGCAAVQTNLTLGWLRDCGC